MVCKIFYCNGLLGYCDSIGCYFYVIVGYSDVIIMYCYNIIESSDIIM